MVCLCSLLTLPVLVLQQQALNTGVVDYRDRFDVLLRNVGITRPNPKVISRLQVIDAAVIMTAATADKEVAWCRAIVYAEKCHALSCIDPLRTAARREASKRSRHLSRL